jgi:hypothetical protein
MHIFTLDTARNITCRSVSPESQEEDICTWVGNAEKLKNEWSYLESYRRDIVIVPRPLWTWTRVYRTYYDHCLWAEIVPGKSTSPSPVEDWLEGMLLQGVQPIDFSQEIDTSWSMKFAMGQKKDGDIDIEYSIILQLPLWALVNMYSLYEGQRRRLTRSREVASMTSSRGLNTMYYMSELRRERRESRKWNEFAESLKANSSRS